MRKLSLFAVLLFTFFSCQEDVKFNNPSFQGTKDNLFWRAVDSKATIVSGGLIIEGYTRNETLTLKTTSPNKNTYSLGINNVNKASYVVTEASATTAFSTGTDIGNGTIVITEYDVANNTVSGTFKFNAENDDNSSVQPLLNFQYGVFYKIPIIPIP